MCVRYRHPQSRLTILYFCSILPLELAVGRFLDTMIHMNAVNKLKNYLFESLHEVKKVTWPSKKQTTNYSIVVIAMSVGIALFFGVVDFVLNQGIAALIR